MCGGYISDVIVYLFSTVFTLNMNSYSYVVFVLRQSFICIHKIDLMNRGFFICLNNLIFSIVPE